MGSSERVPANGSRIHSSVPRAILPQIDTLSSGGANDNRTASKTVSGALQRCEADVSVAKSRHDSCDVASAS